MKRLLLTAVLVSAGASVLFAQNRQAQSIQSIKERLKATQHYGTSPYQEAVSGNETPVNKINPVVTTQPANSHKGSAAQVVVGNTTYDLQSNGSVQNRLYKDNGTLGAVWTFSTDLGGTYPDRGAGYNYFDGSNWGSFPTTRIESDRRGWPSIVKFANGGEAVVSHQSVSTATATNINTTAGAGGFSQNLLSTFPGGETTLWVRTAAGGANGNTLHVIDISYPTGNGGALVNGLDGCINYSRSPDGGATWDIDRAIPPGVNDQEYIGFRADGYAIDSRDDVVAFTSGNITDDWALWKSTDNGTTWTRTVILDFPFTKYDDATQITDIDFDGIADTLETTDGAYAIAIDNNGVVHVLAGAMLVLDENPTDPLGLFLSTDGLFYWNETMGANPPVVIATAPDRDGDGIASMFAMDLGGRYGNDGICSMPSIGIDANDNIFVTYSALMELTDSGNPSPLAFSFRNVLVQGSADGGATWSTPINVSDSDFDEGVFNYVARDVDNCVSMIWQQDGAPGHSVPPNGEHPIGQSEIIYECMDVTTILGPQSVNELLNEDVSITIFPNPATNFVSLNYTVNKPVDVVIEIRNIMGQLVESYSKRELNSGTHNFDVNLASYAAGMYTVNTIIGDAVYSNKFVKN